jgi:hypothetical protein
MSAKKIADKFDQLHALAEGWCIIENSNGWLEVQKDDDSNQFSTDEEADLYVRTVVDDDESSYHRNALRYISTANLDTYANYVHDDGATMGYVYMTLRSWEKESVVASRTVKVRVDYDPLVGPYASDAVNFAVGSNQDLVPLYESQAIPDVTFHLGGFKFADMTVSRDDAGWIVSAVCGACQQTFPLGDSYGQNRKVVLIGGERKNVYRCPSCGALGHQPKHLVPRLHCAYVEASSVVPKAWGPWLWSLVSDDAPFTWGDNNRSMVTANRFREHLSCCLDLLDPDELSNMGVTREELDIYLISLDELGETYIDLEN